MKRNRLFLLFLSISMFVSPHCSANDDNPTAVILPLKIMSYNIRHGEGMDKVFDLDRTAAVISKHAPDIIGLQEVDSFVSRSNRINEMGYLATKTSMHGTFGPAIPLTGGKYGVGILSKERPLSVNNIPLPGKEKRTLLVCEFEHYVFACTHLDLNDSCRKASIPIIVEEAKRWTTKPFYICGDWNDTPSSQTIAQIKRNFTLLNRTTNTSQFKCYTYPADVPTKCIDYIAKYGKSSVPKTREVIDEPQASDHRPIMVEIELDITPEGINTLFVEHDAADQDVYSLDGRRVNQPQAKGVYIVGKKKKYIVK